MNDQKIQKPGNELKEFDLKLMTLQELYDYGCQSSVYWDLVRNAHLNKK